MDYIRKMYGVPVKRGTRVRYTGGTEPRMGTVQSATGRGHLNILLDGDKIAFPYHPKWKLEYSPKDDPALTLATQENAK